MLKPENAKSEFTRDETAATLATLLGLQASEVGCYLILCEGADGSLTAQTDLLPAGKSSAVLALKWAAEVIGHD